MACAVLFLIFNRPDLTQKVFEAIRQYQPEKLFLAADGPRKERRGEIQTCARTREVVEAVDWPCKVSRLYQTENLGCKRAVSEAINWFFDQVEEGIILEDDCLPDGTFFTFCEALLEFYRHDTRVGHISGACHLSHASNSDWSYRFSHIAHIWGWATWRRAWQYYDVEMKKLDQLTDTYLKNLVGEKSEYMNYWKHVFDETFLGLIDTWDYQWNFALLSQGMMGISPEKNLVENIGFDERATHTKKGCSRKAERMQELTHPPFVQRDWDSDISEMRTCFGVKPSEVKQPLFRILKASKKILKRIVKKIRTS